MNLQQAKQTLAEQGITLTPLRQQVLSLLNIRAKPITAYNLLRALRKVRPNAEPPTIYRALEYLVKKGLVHRINSTGTYIRCCQSATKHQSQFLLCVHCGLAFEIEDLQIKNALRHVASKYNFTLENQATEIRGVCARCRTRKKKGTTKSS